MIKYKTPLSVSTKDYYQTIFKREKITITIIFPNLQCRFTKQYSVISQDSYRVAP